MLLTRSLLLTLLCLLLQWYEPIVHVPVGRSHALADEAFATFNRALEPKKLVILPGGHFEAYVGPGFELTSQAACDWFVEQRASACDEPEKCRWPRPLPKVLVEVGGVESVDCSCLRVGHETQ
jgi:hypothetical protein